MTGGVKAQHVVIQRHVRVEPREWHQDETTTPDLMQIFRIELADLYASSIDASSEIFSFRNVADTGSVGMAREDVDALVEWLRSDSLDWDALDRGDAWND